MSIMLKLFINLFFFLAVAILLATSSMGHLQKSHSNSAIWDKSPAYCNPYEDSNCP